MTNFGELPIVRTSDYNYELPDERIAQYPLAERDSSKLLVGLDHNFVDAYYKDVANYLPSNSLMVMNNSKVIPARIQFVKETSGIIEIFCLNPAQGIPESALAQKGKSVWHCMVGGLKKWKQDEPLKWNISGERTLIIQASLIEKTQQDILIEFTWNDESVCFSDILQQLGQMPIPPYLARTSEASDQENYQTVYAQKEGSVAAPTAGLHYTQALLEKIKHKGIHIAQTTLHVGAGTFKPVKDEFAHRHLMHAEWVEIELDFLVELIQHDTIICVGTTSLRTVESLYWYAYHAYENGELPGQDFTLNQWVPYSILKEIPGRKVLFSHLKDLLEQQGLIKLIFSTSLMILPSYQFRVCCMLLTNFHQPQSTLLMLVHAFYGDRWKALYAHAMKNNYRFLSYGDGCLLEVEKKLID